MANHLLKKIVCCVLPILLFGFSFAQHTIASRKQKYSNSLIPNSDSEQLDSQSSKGSGIAFTPNKGQIADMDGKLCPDVLYKSDGSGADVYLRKTGISYVYTNMPEIMHKVGDYVENLIKAEKITESDEQQKKQELLQNENIKIHRVDMDFEGANKNTQTINEHELDGYQNFYYPHCPNGVINIKQFNKVTYKNIYNGIDISYYASTPLNASGNKQSGLKYDFIVKPHADPNQIKLHWKGAESIHLNREGKLVIKTSVNEFEESIPKVYQVINEKIVDIKARYILNESIISFEIGTWNHEYSLIIDPWATYYGGNGTDYSGGITTDNSGNVFITGNTASLNFPVLAGFQMTYGAGTTDAFVVKFNPSGTRLWASFYGGSGDDYGTSIAADNSGNVIFTGYTASANFPVLSGFQMANGGGTSDAVIVKLNVTGIRIWATYYGGNNTDNGYGVATDAGGNVIIAGQTSSANFPVISGFQMIFAGSGWFNIDAFIVKFNSAGIRLWATFYGGSSADYCFGIATDAAGNIAITGYTNSANFPVLGGFQMAVAGIYDVFIVKFNSAERDYGLRIMEAHLQIRVKGSQ